MQACALVLAAGFSSRMQPLFKPLLPLPVQPLVPQPVPKPLQEAAATMQGKALPCAGAALPEAEATALDILCELYAFCSVPVLIVCGHKGEAVAAVAQRWGLPCVKNPQPEQGMFSSVRVGMAAVAQRMPQCTHCFVHPVDIPLVRPMTILALLAAAKGAEQNGQAESIWPVPEQTATTISPALGQPVGSTASVLGLSTSKPQPVLARQPIQECAASEPQPVLRQPAGEQAVFIPSYAGQEGHPPLLPMTLLPFVLAGQGAGGLRALLNLHPQVRVPVADSLILRDMDTAADYAALQALAPRRHLLDAAEADALLAVQHLPERGRAHCRAVGAVAAAFAALLNKARVQREQEPLLDVALARVGGLLHDVCKGQHQHEQAAGQLFRAVGQARLAWLVESHRDISPAAHSPLTERELVYLADKYVQGSRPVSIQQRFQQKLNLYSHDAQACAAIQQRLDNALAMEASLAVMLGRAPEAIARATLPQLI